jgi:hypothetical protein
MTEVSDFLENSEVKYDRGRDKFDLLGVLYATSLRLHYVHFHRHNIEGGEVTRPH